MTARRDIATENTLVCLGGYVAIAGAPLAPSGYVLGREEKRNMAGNRAAAEAAARRVPWGETVFINCGATLPFLAATLPHDAPLTVVCHTLNIATIVCRRPHARVIVRGGFYHETSALFCSRESELALDRFGINRVFVSAGGIHHERGVICSNFHEVPFEHAAMARAEENYLVADAAKFDRIKPARFADITASDRVVTNSSIPPSVQANFADLRPVLGIAGA
jgi:DeoR family deoxyribose operon repressor